MTFANRIRAMTTRSTIVLITALASAGLVANAAAQAPAPERPAAEASQPKSAGKHERHANHHSRKAAKRGQKPAAQPTTPMEQKG